MRKAVRYSAIIAAAVAGWLGLLLILGPALEGYAARLVEERLSRALGRSQDSLVAIFGRRRLGKSRLLGEALAGAPAVYYVGDARDAHLQREALAREIASLAPGFDRVTYPDWEALLGRWWRDAPPGADARQQLPVAAADFQHARVRGDEEVVVMRQQAAVADPRPMMRGGRAVVEVLDRLQVTPRDLWRTFCRLRAGLHGARHQAAPAPGCEANCPAGPAQAPV